MFIYGFHFPTEKIFLSKNQSTENTNFSLSANTHVQRMSTDHRSTLPADFVINGE